MTEVEEAIEAIVGRTVVSGDISDDGLHLWLDDGRVLIVIGIIAVCEVNQNSIQ